MTFFLIKTISNYNNMTKKQNVFKVGNVELPIRDNLTPDDEQYVPTSTKFIDEDKMLERLALGIRENFHILLQGETGVGKTSAFRYLANKTNTPFRRMNLNGSTTVDEFVGKVMLNKEGTYWLDGELIDAMRKGHWILVDEVNAGLPEILFVLQSLLDDDGFVVLSEKDGEVVRPHPDFRIFATMNPSDTYAGTKEMNKALLSRFTMVIDVDFPKKAQEVKMLKDRTKCDDETINKVVEFAHTLRASYKRGDIDYIMSPRDLISLLTVHEHMPLDESAEVTIFGKCNSEDRKVVTDLMKVMIATSEKSNVVKALTIDDIVTMARNEKDGLSGEKYSSLANVTVRLASTKSRVKRVRTLGVSVPIGFETELTGVYRMANDPKTGDDVVEINLRCDHNKFLPVDNAVLQTPATRKQRFDNSAVNMYSEDLRTAECFFEILDKNNVVDSIKSAMGSDGTA